MTIIFQAKHGERIETSFARLAVSLGISVAVLGELTALKYAGLLACRAFDVARRVQQ